MVLNQNDPALTLNSHLLNAWSNGPNIYKAHICNFSPEHMNLGHQAKAGVSLSLINTKTVIEWIGRMKWIGFILSQNFMVLYLC